MATKKKPAIGRADLGMPEDLSGMWSLKRVALYLGVCAATVLSLFERGELLGYKHPVSRRPFFRESDVDAFVKKCKEKGRPDGRSERKKT